MATVTVYNLATGAEHVYANLSPEEALVSCAILEDKRAGDLTNPKVRLQYAKRITKASRSASIGDLAVKLTVTVKEQAVNVLVASGYDFLSACEQYEKLKAEFLASSERSQRYQFKGGEFTLIKAATA